LKAIKATIVLSLCMLVIMGCKSVELRTAKIAIEVHEDWNKALIWLDKEIEKKPVNAEAYYLKGLCYEKLNDWKNMTLNYSKSLELSEMYKGKIENTHGRLLARYINRSVSLFDSTAWENSIKNMSKEELDKYNDERHKKALANLDTALTISPGDPDLYQRAAVIAFDGDDYVLAIEYSKQAIQYETEGKKDLSMREIQLLSNIRIGDKDEVIKWAKKIIVIFDDKVDDPNTYLQAFDALVSEYEARGESELAQQATEDALAQFPENNNLKKNLAIFMVKRQDYVGAKKVYEEVLKKSPDDFDANLTVGTILCNLNKYSDSIPYLIKAHEADPDNIAAVTNLMSAYYNTGQDDKGGEMNKKLKALTSEE